MINSAIVCICIIFHVMRMRSRVPSSLGSLFLICTVMYERNYVNAFLKKGLKRISQV